MNLILSILRRFSLFGVITLILALAIKKPVNSTQLIITMVVLIILYLLFAFLTYWFEKHFTAKKTEQPDTDTPYSDYPITLIRGIFMDIFSPIVGIIDLAKEKTTSKIISLVVTYLLIGFYFAMWLFVL